MEKKKIMITCSRGISPFLEKEVKGLGLPVISSTSTGIETLGSFDDTLMLNLHIRTGQRVLFFLKEFSVYSIEDFYAGVKSIKWESLIDERGYVCVTSSVDSPLITDSRFANQKCKDAIVDRIKERTGKRPDSGPNKDRAVVFIYWNGRKCSVFIDTSGEPLFKRGYRIKQLAAPMQETLAAAVVMATGWHGKGHLINPMCGGGTIAIEAALMASGTAPGLSRNNFGFMHIKNFKKSIWDRLVNNAKRAVKDPGTLIIATDRSKKAVEASEINAIAAGVDGSMDLKVCDFRNTDIPEGGGIIIFNPEYGERMGKGSDLGPIYKDIGDFLKQRGSGYMGYVFTGNLGMAKKVGLRTKSRKQFYSGGIECRLLEYDLYEGSRKKRP
ncbi:MAG: class I SAM-dependent RNA methyltransferase [Nitrospirota bacterium]|nr:MAG: class I SAM-dependent RNA methyltransferase [Nitrospirota bacterium]